MIPSSSVKSVITQVKDFYKEVMKKLIIGFVILSSANAMAAHIDCIEINLFDHKPKRGGLAILINEERTNAHVRVPPSGDYYKITCSTKEQETLNCVFEDGVSLKIVKNLGTMNLDGENLTFDCKEVSKFW